MRDVDQARLADGNNHSPDEEGITTSLLRGTRRRWCETTTALMKKGLRPAARAASPSSPETTTALMKKGLRPPAAAALAAAFETTTALMKKGLRLGGFGGFGVCHDETTTALMKKGLRRESRIDFVNTAKETTTALMKKGLRRQARKPTSPAPRKQPQP